MRLIKLKRDDGSAVFVNPEAVMTVEADADRSRSLLTFRDSAGGFEGKADAFKPSFLVKGNCELIAWALSGGSVEEPEIGG